MQRNAFSCVEGNGVGLFLCRRTLQNLLGCAHACVDAEYFCLGCLPEEDAIYEWYLRKLGKVNGGGIIEDIGEVAALGVGVAI